MTCPAHLIRNGGERIGLFVLDGLGGLPHPDHGKTELEAATTPNLDALAARSSLGRVQLLPPGLTPGSGPGHLSLFGIDPLELEFGRGLLEALGSDYALEPGQIAARGNFCTVDGNGLVQDRRAGRPTDEECRRLCEVLTENVSVDDVTVELIPGKQHRFTWIITAVDLGAQLNDNDPQVTGKAPLPFLGQNPASETTAAIATQWLTRAQQCLADESVANSVLLRGFSTRPHVPGFAERFHLHAAALAVYPMYRGVARLVGMQPRDAGRGLSDQIEAAKAAIEEDFDFLFVHHKDTDTAGHSGDFAAKVAAIEAFDRSLPGFIDAGLDVIAITGDHSTPTSMGEHSWHPVPLLIHSKRALPVDNLRFTERDCLRGELGLLRGFELMPLLLAHADRLDKYGA